MKIKNLVKSVARFGRDENGATAIEYGMIVGLIAAVIVATVALLGPQIESQFKSISDALTAENN